MDYQLIERLALGIAFKLRCSYESPGLTETVHGLPYFWHGATTAHENGCAVLWHLQISTVAFYHEGGTWTSGVTFKTWRGMVDRKEMAGFPVYFHVPEEKACIEALAASDRDDWPSLGEVLPAYIDLDSDYAPPHLPTVRNEFFSVETERHTSAMEAFVRNGFAKKKGQTYRWTEKIAPAMKSVFLWD